MNHLFNPAHSRYFYEPGEDEKKNKKSEEILENFTEKEYEYFDQICVELEKDINDLGITQNFSSRILIRKIAMNIIYLKKVVLQVSFIPLIRKVPNEVHLVGDGYSSKFTPMYYDLDVHPFFEKMIFKFQREIDKGLEKLGLLPSQQIEREKLVVVKKLKQKYQSLGREVSVEAKQEKTGQKRRSKKSKKEVCVEAGV